MNKVNLNGLVFILFFSVSLNASDDNNGKDKINANAQMARQDKSDKWVCQYCGFGDTTYQLCFEKHTPISNWAHRKCPECLGDSIKSCDQCCQQTRSDDCCYYTQVCCQAPVSAATCYVCCKFLCAILSAPPPAVSAYCQECLKKCH